MKIDYHRSTEDYIAFHENYWGTDRGFKAQLLTFLILAPLFVFGIIFIIWGFNITTLIVSIMVAAVLDIAVSRSWTKNSMRQLLRNMKEMNPNDYSGDYTLELGEDILVETHGALRQEATYEKITRLTHDSSRYFIYIGKTQAIILPFSAFANDQENIRFVEFLKQKCPTIG